MNWTPRLPVCARHLGLCGLLWAALCCSVVAPACTVMRFSTGNRLLIARNHDWGFGEGMLVVNLRGVQKTGLFPLQPHTWISEYGSVSLVQFGRELPFAGMNEAGLSVDILQLVEAHFPDTNLPAVDAIQWLQFQLDTAGTVQEVIASLSEVRPAPLLPGLETVHYFVADGNGDSAVIEFLEGKPVVQQSGGDVPVSALENLTWTRSLRELKAHDSRKLLADPADPAANPQAPRFVRAIEQVRQASADFDIDDAFAALGSVSQKTLTQWSMVYDPREKRIWLQTRASPQRRYVDLDDIDFSPEAAVLVMDVNLKAAGNLADEWLPYSQQANFAMVDFALSQVLPDGAVRRGLAQLLAAYPLSTRIAAADVSAEISRTSQKPKRGR